MSADEILLGFWIVCVVAALAFHYWNFRQHKRQYRLDHLDYCERSAEAWLKLADMHTDPTQKMQMRSRAAKHAQEAEKLRRYLFKKGA